jgi:hypothetical protein
MNLRQTPPDHYKGPFPLDRASLAEAPGPKSSQKYGSKAAGPVLSLVRDALDLQHLATHCKTDCGTDMAGCYCCVSYLNRLLYAPGSFPLLLAIFSRQQHIPYPAKHDARTARIRCHSRWVK